MFPKNEAETIALYKLAEQRLPWHIVSMQCNRFPDAIVEDCDGTRLRAEFEYQSRNFLFHRHDPAGCDLIICWQDNWPEAPLPVWVLKDNLPPLDPLWEEWASWLIRELRAKVKNRRLIKVARPNESMGQRCRRENAARTKGQFLSQLYWFFIPGAAYIYMATEEDFIRVGDLLEKLARVPAAQEIFQELAEATMVPE